MIDLSRLDQAIEDGDGIREWFCNACGSVVDDLDESCVECADHFIPYT
jgi:rubrerythrin